MGSPAAGEHLQWGAEALWQRLEPLLPGLGVEVMARVESTNTRLLERAHLGGHDDGARTRPGDLDPLARPGPAAFGRRGGDMQPMLLVAETQTHGRGRLGRNWVSSAGASLTFSLALALSPRDWSGLSLAVGLALAEALDPLPPGAAAAQPRIGLKWPNDLWIVDAPGRGRKLGGILIETVSAGANRMAVVGVGLNVLPQAAEGLGSGYGCLQELDRDITAPAALARVAEPLVRALGQFESHGFAASVAAYAQRDLLRGQAVQTSHAPAAQGIAEGVDESGALLVRSGALQHRVVSGEVSVRLQRPR